MSTPSSPQSVQYRIRKNILAYGFSFTVTLLQQLLILPLAGAVLDENHASRFMLLYGIGQLGAAFEAGIGVAIANEAVLLSVQDSAAAKALSRTWIRLIFRLLICLVIPLLSLAPAIDGVLGLSCFAVTLVVLNFTSATLMPSVVGITRAIDRQAFGVKITNCARCLEIIAYASLIGLKLPVWLILVLPPLLKISLLWLISARLLGKHSGSPKDLSKIGAIIRGNAFDRGLLTASNWIQFTAPILLLNHLDGPRVAGAFAAARSMSRLAWQPSIIMRSACSTEFVKMFARNEHEVGGRILKKVEKKTMLAVMVACAVAIFGASFINIIPHIAIIPSKYLESIGIASYATLLYLLTPLWLLRAGCLDDSNQTRTYSFVSLIGALLVLIWTGLGSRLSGSEYSVWSYLAFELVMCVYVRAKYQRWIGNATSSGVRMQAVEVRSQ